MTGPDSPEPTPYRQTLFDRHGAAAADTIRAGAFGLLVFGTAIGAWFLIGHRLSLSVIAICGFMATVVAGASLALSAAAGAGWQRIMTSGASTPYEDQFSYQDSLVVRGRVGEALASYEAIIAGRSVEVPARLRAAALYASSGCNPQRAAELLREVQSIPGVAPREELSAANRLIELLMGPLGDPGRAMVELRRLIDRHPDTDSAARAKLTLAELKAEMAAREQ